MSAPAVDPHALVFKTPVPSDIAIAQSVTPRPIYDVAAAIGLDWKKDLDLYGSFKAKVHVDVTKNLQAQRDGDWAQYGEEIRRLGEVLERLNARR